LKLKYFLRGFGVGVVLTAIILCVVYRVNTPEQSVVEQAKELGMVFPEGTAAPLTATGQAAENTVSPEPKETVKTAKETPKETAEKTPVETPEATKKTKKTQQPQATKESTEETKGTKFTVRGGLLSSSVAREMMEAGIIESDTALDDYLEESGYAREVIAGTYFIPEGATYEEIAKIITGNEE
jgi:hypothetical protein